NLVKIQHDLLVTLLLFRGKIYKNICFDLMKIKKRCEKYSNLLFLINEISRSMKKQKKVLHGKKISSSFVWCFKNL
ncbi:hypothetical protein D1649_08910, partial [Campylobacter jejuni]|nr:hypothetical protein [Campylobacter jejuni]